jgi:hypothetical protein
MTPEEARAPVERKKSRAPYAPYVAYSPELVAEICRRVSEGEHLKGICREDGMPYYTTFHRWMREKPEAAKLFTLSLQTGGQWCADTIRELCEETPQTYRDKDGVERIDTGWVQWMRMRIDSLKWMASKYYPKVFGERVAVSGEVEVNHTLTIEATERAADAIAHAQTPATAASVYKQLMLGPPDATKPH